MFEKVGTFVFRYKFLIIGFSVAVCIALGCAWLLTDVNKRLSLAGWYDENSSSSVTREWLAQYNGRSHLGDVVIMVSSEDGSKISDPKNLYKVAASMQKLVMDNPQYISSAVGVTDMFFGSVIPDRKHYQGQAEIDKAKEMLSNAEHAYAQLKPADKKIRIKLAIDTFHVIDQNDKYGIINLSLVGDTDDAVGNSYKAIRNEINIPGIKTQQAGISPVTVSMFDQMQKDVGRVGIISAPLVAFFLFLVFGGLIAMVQPLIIGGLTILAGSGIISLLSYYFTISSFGMNIVELVGMGIATDYSLFIVSRFRSELAEGYSTEMAIQRSLMSAGRTVTMSGSLLLVSLITMLIFPQNFLRSTAVGAFLSICIAMILSLTLLPAILSVLGPRIDMFGVKALRRTKTKQEIENGLWGKILPVVLRRPFLAAIPIIALLGLFSLPLSNLHLGGLSTTYLPVTNPTRQAQDTFDKFFPTQRAFPIEVAIFYGTNDQVKQIQAQLDQIPGFTGPFQHAGGLEKTDELGITVLKAGLKDATLTANAMRVIRHLHTSVPIRITGFDVEGIDSINSVFSRLPWMILILVICFTVIMFLAFGSMVLPVKALILAGVTLIATMGVLTWIFTEGHLSHFLNFTPGPLMSVVLVIIIAIIFGLSTDYEIFLISRMIESKEQGKTTSQAIISGTAQTGRIITAATLILISVAVAFALSQLVLMKYIAFGLIIALIMDATLVRMVLVPSIMIITGEDNWWAPRWMCKIQEKIGLGESTLASEIGPMNLGHNQTGNYWERSKFHDVHIREDPHNVDETIVSDQPLVRSLPRRIPQNS